MSAIMQAWRLGVDKCVSIWLTTPVGRVLWCLVGALTPLACV